MTWVETLARPSIAKLDAYKSARSLVLEADVFLDANEAPGPVEGSRNRYPQPQPAALLEKFSALYDVPAEKILIGRGSDEAIDVLTRAFCEPGCDQILITPPTYGMYKVSADIQNASLVSAPLLFDGADWRLDLGAMTDLIEKGRTKLVYVCSPNNPTGTVFPLEDIRALCRAASEKALIVVDEAYGEFAPEASSVPLLKEFSNLVVLRTLSKAWALAGIRCGVALADPSVIRLLKKVIAPYPLPRPVIEEAMAALSGEGLVRMKTRVAALIFERQRVERALRELPSVEAIYPSSANFLLVRFKDEAEAMGLASRAGIVLRSRNSEPGLTNCVRITIGNEIENDLLLQTLGGVR